jgi:CubicO group peptidase (beta-lactamase class C family)
LTASAIYKLADEGIITTDMTMYDYLGIQPWGGVLGDSRIRNITVDMLLNHEGGWDRDVSPVGDPPFDTIEISTDLGLDYPAAPTNVISWMFSKPLDFTPGTTNAYSNFGYSILGRIIEKASGKPYLDYIQQDLLGYAGITNPIGFLNVIQSRSRPRDLAPWEIWYADLPDLYQSAVDYPTNLFVRFADGGGYYESYDSFGGMSASAIGLCHYLLNYWEGGEQRLPGEYYSWDYIFYGSLPGATSVLYQDINEDPTTTNGLEFAALFNERDSDPNDNEEAQVAIVNATTSITSWPTNGGGMIQWSTSTTNINKTNGSVTINLVRSGADTLPVKVSYTTYGMTADNSDYISSSGIVSFAPGQTNQPVTINLLNNLANTGNRQFSLELISSSGGAWLGGNLTSLINIIGAPPQFVGAPTLLAGGGLRSQISAPLNVAMTVQVSTNLSTWQYLETVTNTSGVISIMDANALHRPASFYRLAIP